MGICCMTKGTQIGAVSQPWGVGWEGDGRKVQEGGDIPMADSCWCWQKTTKFCKAIILYKF